MAITPSELRQNIYRLIDQVLETGEPLEIERKGRRLRLVPDEPRSRLHTLDPHPGTIVGDRDAIVRLDWSAEWSADAQV